MRASSSVLRALYGLVALVLILSAPAGAYSGGRWDCARPDQPCYPFQSSGSIACGGCHGGLIPPGTTTQVSLEGLPEGGYVPGESYDLTVNVFGVAVPVPISGCTAPLVPVPVYNGLNALAGFNLEVESADSLREGIVRDPGILVKADPGDEALQVDGFTQCDRLEKFTGCGQLGRPDCGDCDDDQIVNWQATHSKSGNFQFEWQVTWTAPDPGSGDIMFYLAGNAVNGNCREDVGDTWTVTPGYVVPEAQP